jgi:hypothetical protein
MLKPSLVVDHDTIKTTVRPVKRKGFGGAIREISPASTPRKRSGVLPSDHNENMMGTSKCGKLLLTTALICLTILILWVWIRYTGSISSSRSIARQNIPREASAEDEVAWSKWSDAYSDSSPHVLHSVS